jgi:hypothetical protein
MVKYLSKFVLEVLPSVVATVVGAYIVAHYINPKVETPKTEVVATAPAGEAKDTADTTGTVEDKASDANPADAKATDGKPAEVAKTESANTEGAKTESAKTESAKTETAKAESAKAKVPKPDEKKNAIELARAAIERLRGKTVDMPAAPAPRPGRAPAETARVDDAASVAVQVPATQRAPTATPVVTTGLAQQPTSAIAAAPPPLPPPVIVASPYGRHSVGPEAATAAAPVDQAGDQPADRASADRPTPPADIPFQRGYDLQAQAAPVEHISIADHVLSTTKSIFRALTPNSQSN